MYSLTALSIGWLAGQIGAALIAVIFYFKFLRNMSAREDA
jgi:hypothetical protein